MGLRFWIGVFVALLGAARCKAQCVAYLVPISVPAFKNAEGAELWPEHREGYLLALPVARQDYRPESYVKVQEISSLKSRYLPVSAGCVPQSFRRSPSGRVKVFVKNSTLGLFEFAWVSEKDCISVPYPAPAGLTNGLDVQSAAENLGVIHDAAFRTLHQLTATPSPAPKPERK